MNKFITKLAKLFLGISMAAGVGVTIGYDPLDASSVNATETVFTTTSGGGFSNNTKTLDGVTCTLGSGASWQSDHVRVYAGGTISFSSADAITKIVFTYSRPQTWTITGGGSFNDDYTTWTGSATSLTFTNSAAGQFRISSAVVTHGSGGGGGSTADVILNKDNKPYTSTSSSNTGEQDVTLDGIKYHSKAGYIYNTNYLSFNRNQSGAYLGNSTAFSKNIDKIEVDYYQGGSSYFTMYKADSALTETTTVNPSKSGTGLVTYNMGDTSQYFKFKLTTTGTYCNINSISIYLGSDPVPKYTVSFAVTPSGYGSVSPTSIPNVPEGSTITVNSNTVTINGTTVTASPTSQTAEHSYSFDEWTGTAATVTENMTITAKFSRSTRSYTVYWKNSDGTTLETDTNVEYGTTPTYNGATPAKAADAQYTYTFTGWSPAVGPITGNTTYTAQYSTTTNKYTVYWKNYDGTVLETDTEIPYGTTPTYNGANPTKASTAQYHYDWTGWTPNVGPIQGETVYTATFSENVNMFSVSGVISHGDLDDTSDIAYGGDLAVRIVPESDVYGYPESIQVTMNKVDITDDVLYDSNDGSILFEGVTGSIVITAECPSLATYSIDYSGITNGSASGDTYVLQKLGSEADVTITTDGHSHLPDHITVKSNNIVLTEDTDYQYDKSSGYILLSVTSNYTGDIVITATCIPYEKYDVTLSLNNTTRTSGPSGINAIEEGEENLTWVFAADTNYALPNTITVVCGEETLVSGDDYTWAKATGTLVIPIVLGDLVITVTSAEKALDSITLGSYSGDFTLGTAFEKPAVTAHYNDGSSKVVTNSATFVAEGYEDGMFVETGDQTVVISYTDLGATVSEEYTASVSEKSISYETTWVLVEDELEDYSGEYVIIDSGKSYYPTTSTSNGKAVNGTAPSVVGKVISDASVTNAMKWTITKAGTYDYGDDTSDDYYSIKNKGDNKYLLATGTGDASNVKFSTSIKTVGTDSFETDYWVLNTSAIMNLGVTSKYWLRCNGTNGWKCYASSTGTGPTLYKKTVTPSTTPKLIQLTAEGPEDYEKVEGDVLSPADFVATAHYDTGSDYDKVVTPTIEEGPSKLVKGENLFVLSYTEDNVTKTRNVTVVAAENEAQLDGIVWNQEGVSRTIFEESLIGSFGELKKHFDNGSTQDLIVSECTVAVYTKNNEVYTKAHDIVNPTTYTWDLTNDNGKYLGVSFSGYTKYSGVINVVETINSVVGKVESWDCKSLLSSLEIGQTVVMTGTKADGSDPHEFNGVSNSIGSAVSFETKPAALSILTVVQGSTDGSFAFMDSDGKYLSYSTNKALALSEEVNSNTSWNVSFTDTNASITNVGETDAKLQYNSSSPRFCTYTSAQRPVNFYLAVKEYISDPEGADIANTNAVAQKVVLEYAEHFNDVMECIQGGTTANVNSKWSDLSDDFDNWFANGDKDLHGSDLTDAYALFAGADAIEKGDKLQDMLARYEYICKKYNRTDFLHDVADRPPVVKSPNINPLGFILNGSNTNTIAIIVIISMVSVTAIGGYFFLRKRKENN